MPDDTKTAAAGAKPAYSAGDLAKMAKGATVTVFDLDTDGKVKVDEKTKQKLVTTRAITADDIIGYRVAGSKVIIKTVDGQKLEAAA